MNTTNANQTLGFDKFSESDYNLHWSFSNFNRMLMAAGQIAQLPFGSKVLELGAGTSDLENLVKKNFKRDDINFIKVDGDTQYESDVSISVFDITSEKFSIWCAANGPYDCIVFMEVIEHLSAAAGKYMIRLIHDVLKPESMMLFTTPTPPWNGHYEDRVWPLDHEIEYGHYEIEAIINKYFKITRKIGWSLEEREYNRLLAQDMRLGEVYLKLRGAFPESYIRAIIACLADIDENRQVFFVCKKRRLPNGRSAQT